MPVTAGRRQLELRVCLETNLLSISSDILYVVSYHLLCVSKTAGLLFVPWQGENTLNRFCEMRTNSEKRMTFCGHKQCCWGEINAYQMPFKLSNLGLSLDSMFSGSVQQFFWSEVINSIPDAIVLSHNPSLSALHHTNILTTLTLTKKVVFLRSIK